MANLKIEDTILLLDTSRSMIKKDFKPSRISIALQTAKSFVQNKIMIDPKDRISIISFGDIIKKLTVYSQDDEFLKNSLKGFYISGKGNISQAISFSLQNIVQEMRKIGGKVQRIFIITDNKIYKNVEKLEKIIEISKGLGVFIDICQIGKPKTDDNNFLKKIANLTNGEYGYFTNPNAIINAGKEFASKKAVKTTIDYALSSRKEMSPPLVSDIALPLRRPTVMELHLMMNKRGKGEDKCQICHSIKAPITGKDFYSEGRYCPNCDRAMHLSCAAMWAKKSEVKPNVFRCPSCYFLLEVPESAVKLVEGVDLKSNEIKVIGEIKIKSAEIMEILENDINQINASCSYCHNIFLGEVKVYKCQNCESYYHEPCLQKMVKELKACRFCGAEIVLD